MPLILQDTVKVAEAARRLNVQRETIRKYIKQGKLPALQLQNKQWRVSIEGIEQFLMPGGQ
jgi:excisionase family DNA binding protein